MPALRQSRCAMPPSLRSPSSTRPTCSFSSKTTAAAIPDNAYGSVVEGAFKQAVARRNASVVALERYPIDRGQLQAAVRTVAGAANRADAIFLPDGADSVSAVVATLAANGVDPRRI